METQTLIILDTNFLIYCAEKKIDYKSRINELMSSGHKVVVPTQVIDELKKISHVSKKLSDRSAASLALQLLNHNKIPEILTTGKNADEGILKIQSNNVVATLDYNLKKNVERALVISPKGKLGLV